MVREVLPEEFSGARPAAALLRRQKAVASRLDRFLKRNRRNPDLLRALTLNNIQQSIRLVNRRTGEYEYVTPFHLSDPRMRESEMRTGEQDRRGSPLPFWRRAIARIPWVGRTLEHRINPDRRMSFDFFGANLNDFLEAQQHEHERSTMVNYLAATHLRGEHLPPTAFHLQLPNGTEAVRILNAYPVYDRRGAHTHTVIATSDLRLEDWERLTGEKRTLEVSSSLDKIRAEVRRLEERDKSTQGHTQRVMAYTMGLARALMETPELRERYGLTPRVFEELEYAAWLHDIGKIGVRDEILLKPGKLDEDERALMQTHAAKGEDIVRKSPFYQFETDAISMVGGHHEKWDGSGYPRGLRGGEISPLARIGAIADVFEALTAQRYYKPGMPPEKAIEIIRKDAGTHFDPELVGFFIRHFPRVNWYAVQKLEEERTALQLEADARLHELVEFGFSKGDIDSFVESRRPAEAERSKLTMFGIRETDIRKLVQNKNRKTAAEIPPMLRQNYLLGGLVERKLSKTEVEDLLESLSRLEKFEREGRDRPSKAELNPKFDKYHEHLLLTYLRVSDEMRALEGEIARRLKWGARQS